MVRFCVRCKILSGPCPQFSPSHEPPMSGAFAVIAMESVDTVKLS